MVRYGRATDTHDVERVRTLWGSGDAKVLGHLGS
jgi:hypothetical protein